MLLLSDSYFPQLNLQQSQKMMKKIYLPLLISISVAFMYVVLIQYKHSNYGKSNLFITVSNNTLTLKDVPFKVYLDDSLVIECVKNLHPHPYYDEKVFKSSLGKHKITVEACGGKFKKEYYTYIFFVRFISITLNEYSDKPSFFDEKNKEVKYELELQDHTLFTPKRLLM